MAVHSISIPLDIINANLFWQKVKKMPSGCWEWQGSCQWGYGRFMVSAIKKPKLAHRIAWTLTYGEIEKDVQILHKCDNRKCCNPEHLFIGNPKINSDDKWKKGRQGHGYHKSHCKNGHIMNPNTYRLEIHATGISRRCLECKKDYDKRRRAKLV